MGRLGGCKSRWSLLVVLAVSLSSWGSQAHSTFPYAEYDCRASLLRVAGEGVLGSLSVELVVSNSSSSPCSTETTGILGSGGPTLFDGQLYVLPNDLGSLRSLSTATSSSGTDARSDARVGEVTLTIPGFPTIVAELLDSHASGSCCADHRPPLVAASSTVATVRIGNTFIEPQSGPLTISLGPLGDLHLNRTIVGNDWVTQQAFFLDSSLVDVVIAESTVDVVWWSDHGDPAECRDGIDNDGDMLVDADDPGCHTDGDAGNPDSYDPDDFIED